MQKSLLFCLLAAVVAVNASAATFVGDRTDFRDETIYFAMTTRFYDGDPTNNVCGWDRQNVQIANNDPDWRGDFKGLIDKLDYIKALGFTAIWITPVTQNCSGTDFHGYHSMDFGSVDLRYESRKEWGAEADVKLQDLIDAAHDKGMKIILDIVLNHTGNFGEAGLRPLFTRSQNIRDQASASAAIIPDSELLGSDYNDVSATEQYNRRFKYLKNTNRQNLDTHNYWHHWGTGWNWDEPTRWFGQIAGDCVDLNTENPAVAQYLVDCYGTFIAMGVDGFRIDTTGHIARLSFNTSFIPQLLALGEKYKDRRLNQCPFYMFGECCARYSEVIYRGQHNLSSHFYTWQSDAALTSQWNSDAAWWDTQTIYEGDDAPYGNMTLCNQETAFTHSSANALMQSSRWHEPDYSEASGLNVIDFPMHYNFNNAGAAVNIAKQGDKYYNDATYNVVYVDSHDYCPGPNDGTRFNGGTEQWAENLSLMFTFRGIPCIYYGSEVEFQKGKKVDAGGTDTPVKESGRAYYGAYLEGAVAASDFGEYTATGPVATTLGGDLSQHIIRLNQLRAAVPALRKGQYTFDGCTASGGYAFKRAYRDSYALVALGGGATFANLPAGTYTDLITGAAYTAAEGGAVTVSAPTNKGQLRVLVKDWSGGTVGRDGRFIYATAPVAQGGSPLFTDPGTTSYYTADDAVGPPAVVLNPAGGTFTSETLTLTATLNDAATAGWVAVDGGERTLLVPGQAATLTIGSGVAYGATITVACGATSADGTERTATATYVKADPSGAYTVYFDNSKSNWAAVYTWVWDANDANRNYTGGSWPGTRLSLDSATGYYTYTFTCTNADPRLMIIFNPGSSSGQTADLVLYNHGIYTSDGFTGDYFSAIDDIAADGGSGLRIYADNGVLHIIARQAVRINAARLDGVVIPLDLRPGDNAVALTRGCYVLAGRKVIL